MISSSCIDNARLPLPCAPDSAPNARSSAPGIAAPDGAGTGTDWACAALAMTSIAISASAARPANRRQRSIGMIAAPVAARGRLGQPHQPVFRRGHQDLAVMKRNHRQPHSG